MENRGLRIAADILLNAFWIGFAFLLVSWLIMMLGRDYWMDLFILKWQLDMDPAFIMTLILGFYGLAKIILFFYLLVPSLAIRWTLSKLKKQSL